jgi:hypothetical protein
LAISSPKAGNHHDLHQIKPALDEMFNLVENANISLDGLFINADPGFDAKVFRLACYEKGIFANVGFNPRNGENNEYEYLLDEELYKERYSIERTNAWMDSFRSLLNRFDVTVSSWIGFNYIAFMVILLKKLMKKNKFR